jgi:hypothetical protein
MAVMRQNMFRFGTVVARLLQNRLYFGRKTGAGKVQRKSKIMFIG